LEETRDHVVFSTVTSTKLPLTILRQPQKEEQQQKGEMRFLKINNFVFLSFWLLPYNL